MYTEECNAAPHFVQFFIDTDLHCCAADKWKKTPAVDNTRADHWCTLQNHFAIGEVKTMMSSPSVVRETRGTASTVSNHARTSAVNEQHKKMLVGTETVAPQYSMQHLMPCTFQCVLSFAFFFKKKTKDKQNQKLGKAHSHVEGRRLHSASGLATNMNFLHVEEYVLLCEARGAAKANTSNRVVESGANKAWNAACHHA